MSYTVVFSKLAEQKFDRLIQIDRKLGGQIAKAIDRIATHPDLGKFLKGAEWQDCRKYRSGRYRIIYRIEHSKLVILILTIDDRKEVYR